MECTDNKRVGRVIRKCPQAVCKIHKSKTNFDTKYVNRKRSCLKPTVSQEQSDSSNENGFKQKKSMSNNVPDKDRAAKNPRIKRGKSCDLIDHKELYKAGSTVIEVSVKGPRDKQVCKTKSEKVRSENVESSESADGSIDTVPVKLQSCAKKCCHGSGEVTVTTEVKSGSKHNRSKSEQKPTWDSLLRDKNLLKTYEGNSKNCLQSNQPVLSDSISLSGNPVHTLDYLIKELRTKLRTQCEDNTLQQIVTDMECALLKIRSVRKQDLQHYGQGQDAPTSDEKDRGICVNDIDSENVKKLQLKLEESCSFLQKMCEQMQETCFRQQVEKDELSMHLAENRRLLAVAKKKEKDYEATICEVKLALEAANAKTDQQLKSIHELTQLLNRLQEENKVIGPLRETQAKLTNRLKDVTLQLENVSSRLQLVTLEKDKLAVLLHEKDTKLMEMRKNIADIQNLVGTNLINIPVIHNDSDSESLTTTLSTSLPTSHSNKVKAPEIVCSSPASSIMKASPTPSASWRKISSICKKPATNHKAGIKEIFSEMKKQTRLKPNEVLLPQASDTSDTSGFSDSSDTNIPPRYTGVNKSKASGKFTFISDSLRSDESS